MNQIEEILSRYFKDYPEISVVYLFGSEASGLSNKQSDIDVAILFQRGKVPSMDMLLEIEDELISLTKREVDLVVLNDATPIIRMQVLKKGKKIAEHDRKDTNSFFVRTLNEYDDLKQVRSVIEKSIEKGRIYG